MTKKLSAAERIEKAKPEILGTLNRIQPHHPTGVATATIAREANLDPRFCYQVLRRLDIDGKVAHDLTRPGQFQNPLRPDGASRTWVTIDRFWALGAEAATDETRRAFRADRWAEVSRLANHYGLDIRWPHRYGEPVEDPEYLEISFLDIHRLLTRPGSI